MSRFETLKSGTIKGTAWPDAMLLDEKGNPKQLFDFKFKCPEGTRTKKNKKTKVWGTCDGNQPYPGWTVYKGGKTQKQKFDKLGSALGCTEEPQLVTNEDCPK
jgi:hypothetical protein